MEEKNANFPISSFATVDTTQIYYEIAGNGRPVVFLPEYGILNHRHWDEPFHTLAQTYKVLRFDGRGYGKSPASKVAFSNEKDLFMLLQQLDMLPATIIDLSAKNALYFFRAYSEAVSALILVSPKVGMYRSMAEAWTKLPGLLKEALPVVNALKQGNIQKACELTLEQMQISPFSVSAETYQWLLELVRENIHVLAHSPKQGTVSPQVVTKQKQWLKDIHIPTLLLVGDDPSPDIQGTVRILEQELPQFQKESIPNSHNLLHIENPQAFDQAIMTFLTRILGEV